MTTEAVQVSGQTLYPDWLPPDVRHYLVHVLEGQSIRALARDAGVHASTILRQVRRNESRRDDPVLDTVFERLEHRFQSINKEPHEDKESMMACPTAPAFPDETKIMAEARRILRRLAEPDAILAIAPQMEKAVVVRESESGKTIRTGVVDRGIAEAFVVKDWVEIQKNGKVARYMISHAGRAALKRLLSEDEGLKHGFADAQAPFGDQHKEWHERDVDQGQARVKKRIRYNVAESPLTSIARRKNRDGTPYLSHELVAAGERLREDFELSQIGPRVAQNWDRFLTAGISSEYSADRSLTGPESARSRVGAALSDLGPGLGDVALRVCCFLEGMEQAEKRMGWSARSGKIVLKIALQRLERHYRDSAGPSGLIG